MLPALPRPRASALFVHVIELVATDQMRPRVAHRVAPPPPDAVDMQRSWSVLAGRSATAAAVWVIAVVAVVFLLRASGQLLIPVVLGILLSYALEPVVAWLHRHHVPRVLGAGLLLLSILALTGWGAYRLRDDAVQALEALPEVARRARELVWSQGDGSPAKHLQAAVEELQGGSEPPAPAGASTSPEPISAATSAAAGWVQRGVGSITALAGHVMVIVFLVFFLLISGGHFRERLLEVAGPRRDDQRTTATIIDDINAQIQRFLLVRLATSAIVALATWAVLAWMDVPQAAVWGILAGVFNSIPYFGPVIVSGGLLLVGLVQSGDLTHALKMSAAALAITSLEGWLLTPPLLGKAEEMHAVVVFLGVLLWTWIWGAWGTILAVPMLVMVKSVADHVYPLRPISRLMSP
jgi:predicted PurR-regulated permease PerM